MLPFGRKLLATSQKYMHLCRQMCTILKALFSHIGGIAGNRAADFSVGSCSDNAKSTAHANPCSPKKIRFRNRLAYDLYCFYVYLLIIFLLSLSNVQHWFKSYLLLYIVHVMLYSKMTATKYSSLHQTPGRFCGKDIAHMQKSWTSELQMSTSDLLEDIRNEKISAWGPF